MDDGSGGETVGSFIYANDFVTAIMNGFLRVLWYHRNSWFSRLKKMLTRLPVPESVKPGLSRYYGGNESTGFNRK
jgi:hypothetical protein